jgi:hypothetical protein
MATQSQNSGESIEVARSPTNEEKDEINRSQRTSGRASARPKKRPHIVSVPEPERSQLIEFSDRIKGLVELRGAHNGRLPRGELAKAAAELQLSESGVLYKMECYEAYHTAYPSEPPANAFAPVERGRARQRATSPEIVEIIRQAYVNQEWRSLNYDGTVNSIKRPLTPRLIFTLVQQMFGEKCISETTVWRIIKDLERAAPTRVGLAREGDSALQRALPSIDNRASGPNERWVTDIRPLPIVVNYQGILCTVHLVIIEDDYSRFILAWKLLPAKRMDDDGEVVSVDFTCQAIRELFALAMLQSGKRPRYIYADNGSQFAKQSLGPYMHYLVGKEDVPTELVHRRRQRPRGGGRVERDLSLVDGTIQLRPGHLSEQDFRRSRANINKKNVRSFEELEQDIGQSFEHWNRDAEPGKRSFYDIWSSGFDLSLAVPSLTHLAIFGRSIKQTKRRVHREGIQYDRKKLVPLRDDLYEAWADASQRGIDIPLLECALGDDRIILLSLDDGITWNVAVEKGQKKLSVKRHLALMDEVENRLKVQNRQASELLKKALLESQNGPLVLSGLTKRKHFVALRPVTDRDAERSVAEVIPGNTTSPDQTEAAMGISSSPNVVAIDQELQAQIAEGSLNNVSVEVEEGQGRSEHAQTGAIPPQQNNGKASTSSSSTTQGDKQPPERNREAAKQRNPKSKKSTQVTMPDSAVQDMVSHEVSGILETQQASAPSKGGLLSRLNQQLQGRSRTEQ